MIKHWKRDSCRLCSSDKLEKVLNLKPVPIGEKYSSSPFTEEPQRFPIDLYNCQDCSCIQVLDNIDQDFLWSEYTYFSGQTESIINHQEDFADYVINNYKFSKKPKTLDIGSNDGTLLKAFERRGFDIFGVDPADTVASVAKEQGVETLVALFSDKIIEDIPSSFRDLDLITAFNVFAHSDDMHGMIQGVSKLLKPEGMFCFEVQYLVPVLDKNLLGTIFHEHMIHYSVTSANNFMKSHGFKIIDIQFNNIQKGSIIFYVVKELNPLPAKVIVEETLNYERNNGYLDGTKFKEFTQYINNTRDQISLLKDKINREDSTICAYGAARSGPTLAVQFGLENIISYLIDDHPSKCTKFAPFESLEVKSSKSIKETKPDYIVVLAWIHTKNIIINNQDYLNQGGTMVALWPKYKEITSDNYNEWLDEKN